MAYSDSKYQESDFEWGIIDDSLIYIVDREKVTTDTSDILLYIQFKRGVKLKGMGVVRRDYNGNWIRVLHIGGKVQGVAPVDSYTRTASLIKCIESLLQYNATNLTG